MNKLLSILITVTVTIFLCTVTSTSNAQAISSKIMDAALINGDLSIYLTDTLGISGVEISIGTSADTFNIYSQQFSITGNSFDNGNGTISADNVLHKNISGLSNGQDYYTRIRILLDNSQFNEIEIHSN